MPTNEEILRHIEEKGVAIERDDSGSAYSIAVINGARVRGIAATGSGYYDNAGPKHVLMVSDACCIRVAKTAQALRQKGWRVDSLSTRISVIEAFDYAIVTDPGRIPDLIAASGASIIHVHNEPDALVTYAQLGGKGRPVVYDCHDLEYHRCGYVTVPELHAYATADAIIHPGPRYRSVAWGLHPWTAPDLIVRSLPIRAWVPSGGGERSGIVLEGGLGTGEWRDYHVTVERLAARGWPLHMYVRDDYREEYEALGAIVHGWLPYDEMLRELTRYRFGFVGLDHRHDKLDNASPNKLWEYAACGVIPAVCNMTALADDFGPCVSADSIDGLVDAMEACDADALGRAALGRVEWMDDEVDELAALYGSLVDTHPTVKVEA